MTFSLIFPDNQTKTIAPSRRSQRCTNSVLHKNALETNHSPNVDNDHCSAEALPTDNIVENVDPVESTANVSSQEYDPPHEPVVEMAVCADSRESVPTDAEQPAIIDDALQLDVTPAIDSATSENPIAIDDSHQTPMIIEEDSAARPVEDIANVLISAEMLSELPNAVEASTDDGQRENIDVEPQTQSTDAEQDPQPSEQPIQTTEIADDSQPESSVDGNDTTTEESQIELTVVKNTSVRTYQRRKKFSNVTTEDPPKSAVCNTALAISEADIIVDTIQPPARRARSSRKNTNKSKQQTIETDSSNVSLCSTNSPLADTTANDTSIIDDTAKKETATINSCDLSTVAQCDSQAVTLQQTDAINCDVMEQKTDVDSIKVEPMIIDDVVEDKTNGK